MVYSNGESTHPQVILSRNCKSNILKKGKRKNRVLESFLIFAKTKTFFSKGCEKENWIYSIYFVWQHNLKWTLSPFVRCWRHLTSTKFDHFQLMTYFFNINWILQKNHFYRQKKLIGGHSCVTMCMLEDKRLK